MAQRRTLRSPSKNPAFWYRIIKNERTIKVIKINLKGWEKNKNVKEFLTDLEVREGENKEITIIIGLNQKKINLRWNA
jgi:hypothetical protein